MFTALSLLLWQPSLIKTLECLRLLNMALVDEAFRIGHAHLRKRLRIHNFVFCDQAVEVKHIGRHLISLFVGQRFWGIGRHSAADEIKHSTGVGPVTPHCPERGLCRLHVAANQYCGIGVTLAFASVAGCTAVFKNRPALLRGTAAGWKASAAGFSDQIEFRQTNFGDGLAQLHLLLCGAGFVLVRVWRGSGESVVLLW